MSRYLSTIIAVCALVALFAVPAAALASSAVDQYAESIPTHEGPRGGETGTETGSSDDSGGSGGSDSTGSGAGSGSRSGGSNGSSAADRKANGSQSGGTQGSDSANAVGEDRELLDPAIRRSAANAASLTAGDSGIPTVAWVLGGIVLASLAAAGALARRRSTNAGH